MVEDQRGAPARPRTTAPRWPAAAAARRPPAAAAPGPAAPRPGSSGITSRLSWAAAASRPAIARLAADQGAPSGTACTASRSRPDLLGRGGVRGLARAPRRCAPTARPATPPAGAPSATPSTPRPRRPTPAAAGAAARIVRRLRRAGREVRVDHLLPGDRPTSLVNASSSGRPTLRWRCRARAAPSTAALTSQVSRGRRLTRRRRPAPTSRGPGHVGVGPRPEARHERPEQPAAEEHQQRRQQRQHRGRAPRRRRPRRPGRGRGVDVLLGEQQAQQRRATTVPPRPGSPGRRGAARRAWPRTGPPARRSSSR